MAEKWPLEGCMAIITCSVGDISVAITALIASLGTGLAPSVVAALNSVAIKANMTSATSIASPFNLAEQTFSSKAHILICCVGIINADDLTVVETNEKSFEELFEMNAKEKVGFGAYAAAKVAVHAVVGVVLKEMLYTLRKTATEVARVAKECRMGRVGKPRDVAEVVGFFVGDGVRWVNGQVIRTNGNII
ncbi:NADPH-dependent aldehyde reductase-like protein, chloroplastic [Wolffia australiana]